MKKHLVMALCGLIAWVVPFISSFFFFSPKGELKIDVFLFKSIMIVVGSITAALLIVHYFKKLKSDYLKTGIILGLIWLLVNLFMDIIILLPMSGMAMDTYFIEIGIRYIVIPVMCVMAGMVLENNQG